MSVDATVATWKLQKISAIQKLLLLCFADRADESGCCYPSLKRIEVDTLLNRKTIVENRQTLIQMGLISYTGEYKGYQKQIPVMKLNYVFHREGIYPVENYDISTSTENGTSTGNGQCTGTENGTCTSTENGTLNLSVEPKQEPNYISAIYKNNPRFMRFYSEYPRKEKPRDAYKAFKSVVGNNDEMLEMIIADVRVRVSDHDQWQEKRYIPYPATYLRSGDYESEIFNAENEARLKKEEAIRIRDIKYAEQMKAQEEQARLKRLEDENKPRSPHVPIKDRLKNYGSNAG